MNEPLIDKYVLKDTTPWWRFWNRRWTIFSRGFLDAMPLPSSDLVYRATFEGKDAYAQAVVRKAELEQLWIDRTVVKLDELTGQ